MKTRLFYILLITFIFVLSGCDKINGDVTGEVSLHLLQSFETLDQTCAIIQSSIQIEEDPLIAYKEIKSYNSKNYTFSITSSAAEIVKNLEHSVHGLPFAVVADDQVIYTGYFWPAYSSASCQWIVIDPLMITGENKLKVELGYPGLVEGTVIPDERNNQLILDIFDRDGKLID